MSQHRLRARYVELTIDDDAQQPGVYGPDVIIVTTADGDQVPFEKAVLQATYVPITETTAVFGGGMS